MRFKEHWLIGDDDLRKRVAIPEYIADAMADAISSKGVDSTVSFPPDTLVVPPTCPILVFINSRSGGHFGASLLIHLSELIGALQVDISNLYYVFIVHEFALMHVTYELLS